MANILGSVVGMGIDKICNGVGSLAKDIREVITGEMSPSDKAKAEVQLMNLENSAELLKVRLEELQTTAIVAEAQGAWLQKNWRPITMLTFVLIIVNNYIIAPYTGALFDFSVKLDIPPDMWSLLKLGIGGYVLGRSGEKIAKRWKGNGNDGGK